MHQGRARQLQWRLPIKCKHSPVTLVSTESCVLCASSGDLQIWFPGTRDTPAPSPVISDSWGSIMNFWVRFLAALDIVFIWSLKALLLAVAFGMVLVMAAPAMDRPGIMIMMKPFA